LQLLTPFRDRIHTPWSADYAAVGQEVWAAGLESGVGFDLPGQEDGGGKQAVDGVRRGVLEDAGRGAFHTQDLDAGKAGCDQFGGENCPELVVSLVKSGKVSEQRIDQSIRRLLRQKYLGEPLGDLSTVENPQALESF